MLLANYNSDSESDSESEGSAGPSRPSRAAPPPPPRTAQAVVTSTTKAASVGTAKPKRKGPVKITLDLPKGGKGGNGDVADGVDRSDEEGDDGEPEAKKPKLGLKGKGTSALLGMLPPPKRKTPGSTGTTGKPGPNSGLAVNRSMARPAAPPPPPVGEADLSGIIGPGVVTGDDDDDDRTGMLLPASVARGKAKAKAEPAMDLFGLSEPPAPAPSTSKLSTPKPPQISSAPAAPDFVPPAPTPQDPYPGYYQTPSGDWKAYDPAYYASFFGDRTAELQGEKADDGRVGHHWDEYDTKGAHVQDVDVSSSLKAAREEEERKNLAKKPKMPGDEFEYKTIGQTKGLAAQRHQLTSLLHTAYTGREELEERIAQNKKNMRLAGQKYGF